MYTLAQKITDGLLLASDERVIKTAKRFMEDNGYKLTESGKRIACNDLEQLDYPVDMIKAVQLAIINL